MADLTVSYMGIEPSNPVVVAACSLSSKVDTIKRIEEYGAGMTAGGGWRSPCFRKASTAIGICLRPIILS